MQPQFRQMPPGRSASTTATFLPSCAARMAETYPPGPEPTTTTSTCSLAIGLDQETQRRLQRRFEVGQEPGAHGAVHHPVIARERHLHALADRQLAVHHHGLLHDR